MFPEDCIQSIIDGDWWTKHEDKELCRGALIYSFIPHTDQVPYVFEPIGRKAATEHDKADVKVAPLKVDAPLKKVDLPVAAMASYDNEVWAAYRAKRRPCIVLADNAADVPKELTRGMPKPSSAPTVLVAPYFGADRSTAKRAGFNEQFVERVRHCEYPQFMWDSLPMRGGPEVSILRLDQMQPMGFHHHSYSLTGYKLSDTALEIMDELMQWLIWGGFQEDSDVLAYIDLMRETFPE